MWEFLLLLGAVVCLGLAALDVAVSRINIVALGLLCFVLVPFIHAAQALK